MAEGPPVEKTPTANVSVNEPESGTYGEKAAEQRLKSNLPAMDPQDTQKPQAGPMPQKPGQLPQSGGRPQSGPMGVPGVLMGGGPQTGTASPTPAPQPNPQAARITLLEGLSQSQEVSEVTREWARQVLEMIRGS